MKIKITPKEMERLLEWIDLSNQPSSSSFDIHEQWASWVSYPVITHMLPPRSARAILEIFGRLADSGIPPGRILKDIKEKYFQLNLEED